MTPDHLQILLAESGLPPKPADPKGRHVAWALVTAEPGIVYRGKTIKVDEAFLTAQIDQWRTLTEDGYRPPLLKEHTPNGEREGDVIDLRRHTIDGREALLAAIAFADADAAQKIQDGRIKYLSPGFKSFEDDRGNGFDFVLAEISLVSSPHQKRLGDTHLLAMETPMKDEKKDDAVDAEEGPTLAERLEAMERNMTDLKEVVAKLVKPDDDDDEDDNEGMAEAAEMSESDRRLAALEKELQAERKARRKSEFRADFRNGAVVELSEDLVDDLFEVSESVPAAWHALKSRAVVRTADAELSESAPRRRAEVAPDWGSALASSEGNGGDTVALSEMDDEELLQHLERKHDGDVDKALDEFGAIRYAN